MVRFFLNQTDGTPLGLVEVVQLLPAASQLLASSPVADRTFLTQQACFSLVVEDLLVNDYIATVAAGIPRCQYARCATVLSGRSIMVT